MAGFWAPLASTATRNLPRAQAGAGSGVYNMTRQIGSVLGSAAIAGLMYFRLAVEVPGFDADAAQQAAGGSGGILPAPIAGFSAAMSQSLWLSIVAFGLCAMAVLFFAKPKVTVVWSDASSTGASAVVEPSVNATDR